MKIVIIVNNVLRFFSCKNNPIKKIIPITISLNIEEFITNYSKKGLITTL